MKNKGYTVVELVIVLAVFSLFYFIGVGVIAKDINVNYEDTMYEQKIAAIEEQASIYAKFNDELFKDSDTIYLTVKELADAAAIISNKDGEVLDPRDGKSNLNEVKVKITNIDSKVTAKVLS